jgi:hypothetical protein
LLIPPHTLAVSASPAAPPSSTDIRYFSISDIDDYYKKKDPKPLIFCHFAKGLAEKMYDEVPDYASLYKTLMEALNGGLLQHLLQQSTVTAMPTATGQS